MLCSVLNTHTISTTVPAHIEKALVDVDVLNPQHLAPDGGQILLHGRAGATLRLHVVRVVAVKGRQCLLVQFSCRGHYRDAVQISENVKKNGRALLFISQSWTQQRYCKATNKGQGNGIKSSNEKNT